MAKLKFVTLPRQILMIKTSPSDILLVLISCSSSDNISRNLKKPDQFLPSTVVYKTQHEYTSLVYIFGLLSQIHRQWKHKNNSKFTCSSESTRGQQHQPVTVEAHVTSVAILFNILRAATWWDIFLFFIYFFFYPWPVFFTHKKKRKRKQSPSHRESGSHDEITHVPNKDRNH